MSARLVVLRAKDECNDNLNHFFAPYQGLKYSNLISQFDHWHPLTDVYETDFEFIIICDIAGVNRDNVSIHIDGNNVFIQGERNENIPQGNVIFHDVEILYGAFERIVNLPDDAVIIESKAFFKDGFLYVYLKKGEEKIKEKKNIKIE